MAPRNGARVILLVTALLLLLWFSPTWLELIEDLANILAGILIGEALLRH